MSKCTKKIFLFISNIILFLILSFCSGNNYDSLVSNQWLETVSDVEKNWDTWKPIIKSYLIQNLPNETKLIEEVFKKEKFDSIVEEKLKKLNHQTGVDYIAWIDLHWNEIKAGLDNAIYEVWISLFFIHEFEHGWSDDLYCSFEYIPFVKKID